MTTTNPDDPHLWDEDRVVLEVCRNPNSPFVKVPNRDRLEQPLRDNNINGEFLLELDVDTLKTELGIVSLGQRKAMIKGINLLRPSPGPFTMQDKMRRYYEGHETPTQPQLSFAASANEPRPSIEQEIAQTPSFAPMKHSRSSTVAPLHSEGSVEAKFSRQPLDLLRQGIASMQTASMPDYQAEQTIPLNQQGVFAFDALINAPPNNRLSVAPRGSSLQLDLEKSPTDLLDVIEKNIEEGSDNGRLLPLQDQSRPIQDVPVKPRSKKRIAPTFVRHIQKPKTASMLDNFDKLDDDAYLGGAAVPIQDTFYGTGPDLEDENFKFVNLKLAAGYRRAVAKRMQQYFRSPYVKIPNTNMIARQPYNIRQCFDPRSEQLFTLHAPMGEPVVQRVSDWPNLFGDQTSAISNKISTGPERVSQTTNSTAPVGEVDPTLAFQVEGVNDSSDLGDLAFLLEKYPAQSDDDEGLPVYGDSDEENGFDEDTWKEIEAEQAEKVEAKTFLSSDEVASVIDSAFRDFEQEWKDYKLPKVQAKAYQLWMRVAKMKMRQPQRDILHGTLRRYDARLVKLKHAITSDVWSKAVDVKAQCQSIQETANAIFECRYMLKVLERETPPPKPDVRAVSQKSKPKPQTELPDGEEILDSDDDIDAFIVDDSSPAEDIPFAPEDDFNPILLEQSPTRGQDRTSPDFSNRGAKSPVPTGPNPVDTTGDEADAESDPDEKILSPLQKKRRSALSTTPRKLKKPTAVGVGRLSLSFSDEGESGSDSDLDAEPKLPKTKYLSHGQSKTQAIDLTFSDPLEPIDATSSEFDIRTPPLNPAGSKLSRRKSSERLDDGPLCKSKARPSQTASFESESSLPAKENVKAIRKLDWMDVENRSDSIRALFKGVYGLGESEFKEFYKYIHMPLHGSTTRDEQLKEGLALLRYAGKPPTKIIARHQASVELLCLLFMTFVCCKGIVSHRKSSQADFNMSFDGIGKASSSFYKELQHACVTYNNFLASLQTSKRGIKRKSVSSETDDLITDDLDSDVLAPGEQPEHSQSYKKRKRVVKESQEARMQQKSDQQRVEEQELRRRAMESKFTSMLEDGKAQHYVNFDEPLVPLDSHIAGRVKPHQVNGIRFLWREIIQDPKHQGCLLAHTMGLGKTMQVISLLITIAQCNQSKDPAIRAYIPQHLRKSQTLILCPPTLLDNWLDELLMWMPRDQPNLLGRIRKVVSSNSNDIELWASTGGVMIMSYDLFRHMLRPAKNGKNPISNEILAEREKWLLETANLVIADEAHKMKNAKSAITEVAGRIKTRSRIALTGSPLNNHLEEYHTMVNWIAPGYLGQMLQFKAKYVDPINQGLYVESTAYERRVCRKKLHVLKQDLAPKVNRADISAISKDLPSKTEYVITLPMTDLQRRAYDIYMEHMIKVHGTSGRSIGKGLFSLISILLLLCNHPSIFVNKLEMRLGRVQSARDASEETDFSEAHLADPSDTGSSPEADLPTAIDEALDAASPTDIDLSAMEQAAKVFQGVRDMGGLEDPRMSYRAVIVQEILQKAMKRGDKTLLFSHSLDTLDYLGTMLDQMGCRHMRIDGKTAREHRQTMTKKFNESTSRYQVCLVSTKAGGLGLNFQGASRVIIYDFGFNPMWEEQAVGRAYRMGQKQPVYVYRFKIGGTVEEVINNKAVFKTQLFSRVVDKKNPIRYASNAASDYVFMSRDVEQHEYNEYIGKDPDVLDTIIAESDKIRNIELTETFHKEDNETLDEQELKEANEEYDRQRLERDDPVAYRKKYGSQNQPTQSLTPAGIPRPPGSRPLGASVSAAFVAAANSAGSKGYQLGPWGPADGTTLPQKFDQTGGAIHDTPRPGAPSPPSVVNSPPAVDTPTPGNNNGDEQSDLPDCEPQ